MDTSSGIVIDSKHIYDNPENGMIITSFCYCNKLIDSGIVILGSESSPGFMKVLRVKSIQCKTDIPCIQDGRCVIHLTDQCITKM